MCNGNIVARGSRRHTARVYAIRSARVFDADVASQGCTVPQAVFMGDVAPEAATASGAARRAVSE
jgi:hypothetical protein